jgi:hypothetical protein
MTYMEIPTMRGCQSHLLHVSASTQENDLRLPIDSPRLVL